ncbi:MAG TPA: prepilin-type N-terminal cleavage/methylation domain-containing protein [Verrucomicrobiae bacterium]|nr:prepilin-type N-terminal cleavage/methylation domain-containing protein [Verrucomicrobiae bacterium]
MTLRFARANRHTSRSGFTLAEVIISIGIAAMGITGIVWGYILTSQRAEWTTCSAAAQQMAMRRLEQVRAAKWDPFGYPPVDELVASSFAPNPRVEPLDVPLAGTNKILATNVITIFTVYTDPPLKVIRVDCKWSLMSRGPFTNTLLTYRTSDW